MSYVSVRPEKYRVVSRLGEDQFLPNPCGFTSHLTYYSTLCGLLAYSVDKMREDDRSKVSLTRVLS
jgi:hypothetical protein